MTLTLNQMAGITENAAPTGAGAEFVGRKYDAYTARFTDAGTAANGQTIETIVKLDATQYPNGARLVAAYVAPGIAVTADATNFKSITFSKLTAAGASATTIATWTTELAMGNLAANQAGAATVVTAAAADYIAAGGIIAYAVVGTDGTGVAMNASTAITKGNCKVTIILQAL